MIEKMKFISITGPKADIDRMMEKYLSKYEIHLENALSELKTVKSLTPYIQSNPYKELCAQAKAYIELAGARGDALGSEKMDDSQAIALIQALQKSVNDLEQQKKQFLEKQTQTKEAMKEIKPFLDLDFPIERILGFKFIKFRFGRFHIDEYKNYVKYVASKINTIFYVTATAGSFVWGVFFVPAQEFDKIDTIFASLHFESIYFPEDFSGTPKEIYESLQKELAEANSHIGKIDEEIRGILAEKKEELASGYLLLKNKSENFDIRKMAACTRDGHNMFYILCGWMPEKQAEAFRQESKSDANVFCIVEEDHNEIFSEPPTKLKNPKIFKPFEMFIKMYGLPAYDEFDPTIFVALSYTLIFGAMFGDAGQGICLVIGGALLYKFKKMDLAGIISMAGIFSTLFGFLYGSFFGFEDVIPALWLKPMEETITLPVVGTLNTVLVVSVAFGMGLILLSMLFQLFNGIRNHDKEKIFFDTNGLPGIVFYGFAVLCVILFMTGHTLPGTIVLMAAFGIPLLLMLFKEPLMAVLEKKKELFTGGPVMYLVQSFFELFEVVLSYLTNTISFVRIGAFALSHAGMMQVVLMLAGAEAGGSPNWAVVVGGNIFVAAMEGLIVGIHVLRLEYYEMFSRFFKGSGREFKPYKPAKEQ